MKKTLLNIFSLTMILSAATPALSAEKKIPKAEAVDDNPNPKKAKTSKNNSTSGLLYRMDKNGNVKVIPINDKTLEEHNIRSNKEGLSSLAKLESKKVLGNGVSVKAVARKNGKDEFNDEDASAKPALYFSFGFGRPYWGGYNCNYYNPPACNYYDRPYYYGGYYAPRVVYVGDCYYRPICAPYYYSGYYYSYYSYGSCWY